MKIGIVVKMKNRKVLIVILFVFVFSFIGSLLLSTIGNAEKLGYDKIKYNSSNKNIVYTDWMKYILDSNIEKISLVKSDLDEEDIAFELTKEELKEIFIGLLQDNDSLTKVYSDDLGFMGGNSIIVSFKINEKKYKFQIRDGMIFCYDELSGRNDNQEFFAILAKEKIKVIDQTNDGINKDTEYVYKYQNVNILDIYICKKSGNCNK